MQMQFDVKSSDPALLAQARRLAEAFTVQYRTESVFGVVLLGAIPRGYFDRFADLDVAVFKAQGARVPFAGQYQHVDGTEIHCHMADYEDEMAADWDMAKRWTFSRSEIVYDPRGAIARMLDEKIQLKDDERKWLLMSGLALSEWYVNRLTALWAERGDATGAHFMIARGLDYFLDMLFGLNRALVADAKWKYYCAARQPRLPTGFHEHMQAAMLLKDYSLDELARRREAFMGMWREMLPVIESELSMSYAEMLEIV